MNTKPTTPDPALLAQSSSVNVFHDESILPQRNVKTSKLQLPLYELPKTTDPDRNWNRWKCSPVVCGENLVCAFDDSDSACVAVVNFLLPQGNVGVWTSCDPAPGSSSAQASKGARRHLSRSLLRWHICCGHTHQIIWSG